MKIFRNIYSVFNSACFTTYYRLTDRNDFYYDRADGLAKLIRYNNSYCIKQRYVNNLEFSSLLFFRIKNEMANDKIKADII